MSFSHILGGFLTIKEKYEKFKKLHLQHNSQRDGGEYI